MEYLEYTTNDNRQKGRHLTLDERGIIKHMHKHGFSNRAIARELNCSPTTIGNELKRGIKPRTSKYGPNPSYNPKHAQAAYIANRKKSCKPVKLIKCMEFIIWCFQQVTEHKWSLDSCVGRVMREHIFPDACVPCVKTLYNWIRKGLLPISMFHLPLILKRRKNKNHVSTQKCPRGTSIDDRPDISGFIGHWEGDTVVGKKKGHEAVIFTLVEKFTHKYIALRIDGRTTEAVSKAMQYLYETYGSKFSEIFKSITVDNGPEFADFESNKAKYGCKIYFAHPYCSSERGQNESHNGILRQFVPKGISIEKFSAEDIEHFADEINSTPRRSLGYYTADELFEPFLDYIYAI